MKIELGQYRVAHISGDELCVLAAFLKLPCLYGISASWMKRGYLGLEERILRTAAGLEQNGILLTEPGGIVRMDGTLYGLVTDMGRAGRLGRIAYAAGNEQGRLYVYRTAEGFITAEWDGRGNYHLGRLERVEELEAALTGIPGEASSDSLGRIWLGALVFERSASLCQRVFDLAWAGEDGNLEPGWAGLCRALS